MGTTGSKNGHGDVGDRGKRGEVEEEVDVTSLGPCHSQGPRESPDTEGPGNDRECLRFRTETQVYGGRPT